MMEGARWVCCGDEAVARCGFPVATGQFRHVEACLSGMLSLVLSWTVPALAVAANLAPTGTRRVTVATLVT
jgi:hypothetical protein